MANIISRLLDLVNGPYQYRAGPNTLGVGVENLALVQPPRAIDQNFYSPRYDIQRSMRVRFDTVPNTGQFLPDTDLRANGVYLSGDIELQGLIAEYNRREG